MKKMMKSSLEISFAFAFLFTVLFISNGLSDENYPNRPITMIVPWTGGMTDSITRVLCKVAEKALGQPIVIEYKTGGGGAIGVNYVLKSKPDGYTLGVTTNNTFNNSPHLRKLPYDPLTDVTDVIGIFKYPLGLCVRTDASWNTWEDLIAYAKSNPGKFRYANANVGGVQHITMERIAMKEGIKWTQVPFKSGGECVLAALRGDTDAVIQGPLDVLPYIKEGKLKMLLAINENRWPSVPKVPNILEKGYGFWGKSYGSAFGPRGLPQPIRQKLEDVFKNAMKDPSFTNLLKDYEVEPANLSGKEYSAVWRAEYEVMGRIIGQLGLAEK